MKKIITVIALIFIAIFIYLNLHFLTATIIPINSEENNDLEQNEQTIEEPTGENLVSNFSQTIIRDDTGEKSFGNLGDSSISKEEALDEYGLSFNLEVFDTNDNSLIDIDEETPVKITITNDSSNNYIISDLRINASEAMFEDDSFTNLQVKNINENTYTFNRNRLTTSQDSFTLKANDSVNFYFNAKWSFAFFQGQVSDEFIQFDFIATQETSNEKEAIPSALFQINTQTYNFSNNLI